MAEGRMAAEEGKHGAVVAIIPPHERINSPRWVAEANACAAMHGGVLVGPPELIKQTEYGLRALLWAMTPATDTQPTRGNK